MPDITMCTNESCELRNECFRFRAEPNEYRQSYFMTNPQPVNGECDDFMKLNPAYRLTTLKPKQ